MIAAGIHAMPAEAYHADPAPAPSLSSSLARLLDSASPLHAWAAHPRLGRPKGQEKPPTPEQDEGTALHALVLEGQDRIARLEYPDYKTAAAREARDQARAAGMIPIRAGRWAEIEPVAAAIRRQLDAHRDAADAFTAGRAEQVLLWQEVTNHGAVWCRARVDWLGAHIDDLKTTGGTAHPDAWSRAKMLQDGYAMQAAFYLRGARACGLRPKGFRFVVAETDAPHAVSVLALAPDLLALAEEAVSRAIDVWGWCLHHDRWPGYPDRTCWIEAPSWALSQAEDRKQRAATPFYMQAAAGVLQSGAPFA